MSTIPQISDLKQKFYHAHKFGSELLGQDYGQGTVRMTWLHDFWGPWLGRPSEREGSGVGNYPQLIGEKAEGQTNEQVCPCLEYYGKKISVSPLDF